MATTPSEYRDFSEKNRPTLDNQAMELIHDYSREERREESRGWGEKVGPLGKNKERDIGPDTHTHTCMHTHTHTQSKIRILLSK